MRAGSWALMIRPAARHSMPHVPVARPPTPRMMRRYRAPLFEFRLKAATYDDIRSALFLFRDDESAFQPPRRMQATVIFC